MWTRRVFALGAALLASQTLSSQAVAAPSPPNLPSRLILDLRREFGPARVPQAEYAGVARQLQRLMGLPRCALPGEALDRVSGHFTQSRVSEQALLISLGSCNINIPGVPITTYPAILRQGQVILARPFSAAQGQLGNVGDLNLDGLDELLTLNLYFPPVLSARTTGPARRDSAEPAGRQGSRLARSGRLAQ